MRELDSDFNLTTLADRYGSDKGSVAGFPHNYTLLYDMILGSRRGEVKRMLEIGLLRGGPEVGVDPDRPTGELPSIRMWLDYFPEAIIHGFDISDFSFYQHPRFVFTRGDAGDDLRRVLPEGGELFDFIIDDGSHASYHQQLSFHILFQRLRPGGIYVIEDLQWQSPIYEETLPRTWKTEELMRNWLRTRTFPPFNNVEGLSDFPIHADAINMLMIYDHPFIPTSVPKAVVIHKKY